MSKKRRTAALPKPLGSGRSARLGPGWLTSVRAIRLIGVRRRRTRLQGRLDSGDPRDLFRGRGGGNGSADIRRNSFYSVLHLFMVLIRTRFSISEFGQEVTFVSRDHCNFLRYHFQPFSLNLVLPSVVKPSGARAKRGTRHLT